MCGFSWWACPERQLLAAGVAAAVVVEYQSAKKAVVWLCLTCYSALWHLQGMLAWDVEDVDLPRKLDLNWFVTNSYVSPLDSCRALRHFPNVPHSVRLLVKGKQWGQSPCSTDGMSGGAEQADILSVLSLVKERWKVVSGVFFSYNGQRVCPVPALPVPGSPSVPLTASLCSSNSALRPPESTPAFISPVGLGSCLCVHVVLLRYGKSKNSFHNYSW